MPRVSHLRPPGNILSIREIKRIKHRKPYFHLFLKPYYINVLHYLHLEIILIFSDYTKLAEKRKKKMTTSYLLDSLPFWRAYLCWMSLKKVLYPMVSGDTLFFSYICRCWVYWSSLYMDWAMVRICVLIWLFEVNKHRAHLRAINLFTLVALVWNL